MSNQKYTNNRLFTRATTTSYDVALELANGKKPLSDRKIVKRCAVEMAKAFGDHNLVKNFETVSLSRRTVTRRIFDIHDHVEGKLKQFMHDCKYFSGALDESTDVMDVSQLLIFTRTIEFIWSAPGVIQIGVFAWLPPSVASAYGGFDKGSSNRA